MKDMILYIALLLAVFIEGFTLWEFGHRKQKGKGDWLVIVVSLVLFVGLVYGLSVQSPETAIFDKKQSK